MTNLVDQYLKKVAKETDDTELKRGIDDRLGLDIPDMFKPKSSFKDANKRMKEIEDDRNDKA